MTGACSSDDVLAVMAAACAGDMSTRVALPLAPTDDAAARLARALNTLLDERSAAAIVARRTELERDQLARRLQILADAVREFSSSTQSLQHLLDVVARRLGELVGDMCTIRTVSDDGEWLESSGAAYHGDPALLAATREVMLASRQRVGEGTSGRVAATGEALLTPMVRTSDFVAWSEPRARPLIERLGVSTAMTVPLSSRGRVVGIANLMRGAGAEPYTDDDLRLVQSVADHAALAIENARSYAAERAARDAARESEQKSQRIVESAMVGMWTLDAEGKTTFMNRRMASILGVDAARALRTPIADFFPPVDRALVAERLATRKAGFASTYEQTCRKADGSSGLLSIESSPLYDASGRFEGVLGIVTEITERRRAEETLKASELRYRLMFESSPLAKWVYDADTLRFLDVNAAMIKECEYSRDEFLGMTIKDLYLPEDLGALLEAERSEILSSKFGTWRIRKKSGDIIQVEITKHTLKVGDRHCRLGVGRDMTERIRLEEQLRQSQKMEAVGRLAGGVAHDFNNVLSVILGYGEMLLADLEPGGPMREDMEEICKAGQRASDLTRQLLMFSRQQVLAPKVVDLNETLASMDKMLQRILGADIDLVSRPAPHLGSVRVDPSSMEQAILNLVVNARDAMPTGGRLTMETANVVLDETYAKSHLDAKPGPHVMFAVTDTGSGMNKATLARIFEPFFTTKESGKGTGLGLSTVFGIVHQSGGSVWVYSEVGKGSTFKVYLPRVDDGVESVRPIATATAAGGSETILLVEDDDQVRGVARGILRRSGYHVIEACNGDEALRTSQGHRGAIDLLLTDVVMPQMSGPELAKQLGSVRPTMKVLCMSGYTDDSIVRHGVIEERVAYLQKPITPGALTKKVRDVLDGKGS